MNRRDVLIGSLAGMAGMGTSAWWRLGYAGATINRGQPTLGPLDDLQLGHLNHIRNLASMPDGEWRHMGAQDPGQEALDSYRYQLAFMAYSLGITAYHHLPAAPLTVKQSFDRLIQKMLRREVWDYWAETSRSGPAVDPGLTELREPWIDPVVKENIMYSGHLLAMVGMYRMLFGDSKYDSQASLTFRHAPIFSGLGPDIFEYDHASLNEVIYKQFSDHNWLGVPCEPNMVFVVCNQYPIIGFRFYDAIHGTNRAEEVIKSFDSAWKGLDGYVGENGNVTTIFMERQAHVVQQPTPLSAWTLAALNAWKPDLVRSLQQRQTHLWLDPKPGGRASVRATNEIMALANKQPAPETPSKWYSPDFGYTAMWLSEMGDSQNLDALLKHADQFMHPTWEHGGLFYPRNDQSYDETGELSFMDPLTGNALLGYARLNPADGMRNMFQNPWKQGPRNVHVAEFQGADLLRATYADSGDAIDLQLGSSRGSSDGNVVLVVSGLDETSSWSLSRGSEQIANNSRASDSSWHQVIPEGVRISISGVKAGRYTLKWG